jgi:hypothetical protein
MSELIVGLEGVLRLARELKAEAENMPTMPWVHSGHKLMKTRPNEENTDDD